MTALPAENRPEFPPATFGPPKVTPAAQARKNNAANYPQPTSEPKGRPTPTTRVSEKEFVQAIARWLEGTGWQLEHGCLRPYHGINVRLRAHGDELHQEGVPVVSRNPPALLPLPEGTRTSNRIEARSLAAVAVRGDAGWYR